MAKIESKLAGLKNLAEKATKNETVEKAKERVGKVTAVVGEKAVEAKDAVVAQKEKIEEKLTELDTMLRSSITDYNDTYTQMSDKGLQLYIERSRAGDTVSFVETLVNSIANKPKTFEKEFEDIVVSKNLFLTSIEFAERELRDARAAATGAGAGLRAGTSVAFMARTAAMWVATTFGTASTGTAISTLSGAAASNAAIAWLGGGALAAGGSGMRAGNALLALSGPVGLTIAGASLLSSIVLFSAKKTKTNKQKSEEIEQVKENTEKLKEIDQQLAYLLSETQKLHAGLRNAYGECLPMFNGDYSSFTDQEKIALGNLINNTKALSALLGKTIE